MKSEVSTSKPKKSQLEIILTIVLIVLIGVGSGLVYFYSRGDRTKSAANNAVSLNPICKYEDPDLCIFINGWKEVKFLTANSTSTFEGKPVKFVIKSAGDFRDQITSYEGETEQMNIITIGKDTYTKDMSDGKWTKSTRSSKDDDASSEARRYDFDEKAELAEDKTTYKKIGEEPCDKYTCFKYQVIDPEVADSTDYILFDNEDYKLRKTITLGPDNNEASSEFDFSRISIDIPSPLK